jgi:hypothetical protein
LEPISNLIFEPQQSFYTTTMSDLYNGICPIWKTPAAVEHLSQIDSSSIESPRAGGKYVITGTAAVSRSSLREDQKVRLTSWLISQRMMGDAAPLITSDHPEIATIRRPSVPQRAENLLKYINSQISHISDVFEFPHMSLGGRDPLWKRYAEMLAWSASTKLEELEYLRRFLDDQDLIGSPPSQLQFAGYPCTLTVRGHAHLAELKKPSTDSMQAFVAMWFDSSLDEAYHKGIKPAIEDSGYAPMRIDEKEHFNRIDDEIIAEIRRSKFLVADLTEGTITEVEDGPTIGGTRGSVYYEAGFAHGLNRPVIYTCREDTFKKIHFDLRQYVCIDWDTPVDLKSRLAKRISAIFGDGPAPRA